MRRMLGFAEYEGPKRKLTGDVQPKAQEVGELEEPTVVEAGSEESEERTTDADAMAGANVSDSNKLPSDDVQLPSEGE